MRELVIGIASSLIATGLTVAAGWFGLSWPRKLLLRLLSRVSGLGVVRAYKKQSAANTALAADLRAARWIKVLAGRGNELTRDSFQEVWRQRHTRLRSVQILLPDPADPGRWLQSREEEMRRVDPGFESGLLAKQVSANIAYLSAVVAANPEVEMRLFDAPHTCRAIITDHFAYFTPYLSSAHGRNTPCFVFGNGSVMYDHLLRTFENLWSAGR
ncbi:hypothetical protein [Streptosporangium sp. NPDC023615]|uniref:hypothetical protein n=1 Tax=Streptosporangium sp. NPDC023615 TaxID=3154794 RepID=UPI0034328479